MNLLSGSRSDASTVSTMIRASAKWHADGAHRVPSERISSWGSSCEQMSCAFQQRVWNRHPDGGFAGEGTSPTRTIWSRLPRRVGSGAGTAESSAWVYGCVGRL